MRKCLILLLAVCLLTGCKSAPPVETQGNSGTNPTAPSINPTVPETVAPTDPTEPTEPPAPVTVYFWRSQKVTNIQGVGGVYARSYDKNGNMLTESYASEDVNAAYNKEYSYDAAGRMLTCDIYDKYSATGHTEFTYDAAGRLVKEVFTNNEGYSATTQYTYGPYGGLVEKSTVSGKNEDRTVYTFDEKGRVVVEEQILTTGTKVTKPYRFEYTYDENGNKASRKEYRMENLYLQEQWTYDDLGNVLSHRVYDSKDREQEAVEYLYFPDGKLDQETFYRGASSVSANYYIYDEAGRVIKKATGTPYEKFIDVRQNVLYTYDEHGNLLTEVTAKKDGTELSRREYTYISMEVPVK